MYSKVLQLYLYVYPFFSRSFTRKGYYSVLSRVPCAKPIVYIPAVPHYQAQVDSELAPRSARSTRWLRGLWSLCVPADVLGGDQLGVAPMGPAGGFLHVVITERWSSVGGDV